MSKTTVVIIGFMIVIFAISLLVLRSQKMDLVHAVVVNTVIQKAPRGYERAKIRRVFDSARRKAEQESREQDYYDELLRISQRLEKVQEISQEELETLLESIDR